MKSTIVLLLLVVLSLAVKSNCYGQDYNLQTLIEDKIADTSTAKGQLGDGWTFTVTFNWVSYGKNPRQDLTIVKADYVTLFLEKGNLVRIVRRQDYFQYRELLDRVAADLNIQIVY